MTRLRGWAPKGERLIDKVPQGRWKTATFLAALRQDRIDAPCLFDGPINGERFRAYVEQFLVPTLKPGDVVILDNLGSHKGKAVRRAIRDVGARLVFLPKYSPDLNPIEQVFAKFKTLLRKVGARTYEAISDASAEILAQYQPAECAAYLKIAGYFARRTASVVVALPCKICPIARPSNHSIRLLPLDKSGTKHLGKGGAKSDPRCRRAACVSAEILPDLNPIEQVFAKFKTLLRKVGSRTYQAISDASAEILAQYQPAECAAYLKNAGYA